jgi:hypothetical protein
MKNMDLEVSDDGDFWNVTLCNLVKSLLTFRRNILPPSSGLKSTPSIRVASKHQGE